MSEQGRLGDPAEFVESLHQKVPRRGHPTGRISTRTYRVSTYDLDVDFVLTFRGTFVQVPGQFDAQAPDFV